MRLFTRRDRLSVRELTIFSLLGSIMFITKFVMQWIPNVHLLALFIAAFTLTYRAKALIPLYVYILLDGVVSGFSMWWAPYLYIWFPLWLVFMLAGKVKMPQKIKVPFYMLLCGLHGLSFGIMYAPAQAFMFGLNFKSMIAWIVAGLPFDLIHGVSDFFAASLILPLHSLLVRLEKQSF